MADMPIHPAISINTLCLPTAGLAVQAARVVRLGVAAISPTLDDVTAHGVPATQRLFADSGLRIATLTHRAFGFATPAERDAARDRLARTIDIAHAVAAPTITFTSGGRGHCTWPEAAARFADAIAPCAERARAAGIKLSLEPTSHLYADASIAHRLTDTIALVRAAGIHLGIDIFACWFDADIDAAIDQGAGDAALVQVSDYAAGDRALPCRAVPGDGMARLDRLIPRVHAAGFRGFYDIEIFGPRIDAEGAEAALARAISRLAALIPDQAIVTPG